MENYDPSHTPNPNAWLELDEQERILLVEGHHRGAGVELPDVMVHAMIHVVVENQVALNDVPVLRALARLMKEGLSRHDAVHAIGSILAEQIFDDLKLNDTPEALRTHYYAAIERLTAATLLSGGS